MVAPPAPPFFFFTQESGECFLCEARFQQCLAKPHKNAVKQEVICQM